MECPRAFSMLLLAALVAACGGGSRDASSSDSVAFGDASVGDTRPAPPNQQPPGSSDTSARPATRIDTMMIEGYAEPFTSYRVDAALYSTYRPADMLVEQSASGEGDGVRFIANFGGTRNDSAFLHIFVPSDADAEPDAVRQLLLGEHGIVRSNGLTATLSTSVRYQWARESYAISGPSGAGIVGSAGIGAHRGRSFIVIAVHPMEYGDGMGPRVASILDALMWSDTGTGLALESPER